EIAKKALEKNTLVVIPTGMGKTNIALLAIAERLNKSEGKILFMAPTKPLVEQHKKTFDRLSEICDTYVVTGTTKPEAREKLYKKARVVFATPQTIENDIKNHILKFDDFIYLVVDEAHRSVGNYAYTFIAEAYMRSAKSPLIIALTASPGGRAARIDEIRQSLFIEQTEFRSEKDSDVGKYVKEREINTIEITLPEDYLAAKKLLEKVVSARSEILFKMGAIPTSKFSKKMLLEFQAFYSKKAQATRNPSFFAALSKIAELIKLDYCLELLETQGAEQAREYVKKLRGEKTKAAGNILSNPQFVAFARLLESLGEHPKMEKICELAKR
ncbi:MAG: DEAD/DEAH box helicase, partial [Candidatus Aenigmatarchaeota archaeon]